MSENEVKEFNPSDLTEGIKTKIKAEFAGLIPDNIWTDMVDKVIKNFISPIKNRYNSNEVPSEFDTLVKEVLSEHLKGRISDYISQFVSTEWDGNKYKLGDKLAKLIKDNIGDIMTNMIGNTMQQVVNNMNVTRY